MIIRSSQTQKIFNTLKWLQRKLDYYVRKNNTEMINAVANCIREKCDYLLQLDKDQQDDRIRPRTLGEELKLKEHNYQLENYVQDTLALLEDSLADRTAKPSGKSPLSVYMESVEELHG